MKLMMIKNERISSTGMREVEELETPQGRQEDKTQEGEPETGQERV